MHQGCAFPSFPRGGPDFSLVLIAGLSSLSSPDQAFPDGGKHGSPPTWTRKRLDFFARRLGVGEVWGIRGRADGGHLPRGA